MERGEQSAGRAEGDVPTTGAPGSSQGSQGPQQQEQERSQEGQNQPFTTSPTQERGTTPPGPPAPPKTGRESVALGVRRLSMNPERYPPDEAGAPSASGHITPSRDYARGGVPPPQRARSRDDGAAYRSGEGVVPPTRRRGSGLDWIIPGAEQKQAYTVSHYQAIPRSNGELMSCNANSLECEQLENVYNRRWTMLSKRKPSMKGKVCTRPRPSSSKIDG